MVTQPVLLEVSVETARSVIDSSHRGGQACKLVRAARKRSFQQSPRISTEEKLQPTWLSGPPAPFRVFLPVTDLNATNTLLTNLLFLGH